MRVTYRVVAEMFMALIAALQFLTRLPIPIRMKGQSEDLVADASLTVDSDAVFRRSVVFFPVAGLLIGAIVAALGYGLDGLFPAYVNAVLLLGVWVFLSGGLHLDGLMDTADGLLSHRSRERKLEIMKDSRVGAMGVIVCVLYLLLKTTLIIALLDETGGVGLERFFALAAIPVWSRGFMVTAIAGWPYARKGQGMGQLFRSVNARHAVLAFVMAMIVSVGVFWLFGLFDLAEAVIWSFSMAVVSFGVGWAISSIISRKLGGLTGDVYGALNEIIELCLLVGLVGSVAVI